MRARRFRSRGRSRAGEGAAVIVEPIEAGEAHWPPPFFEREGGPDRSAARPRASARSRQDWESRSRPRLPGRAIRAPGRSWSTPASIPRSPGIRSDNMGRLLGPPLRSSSEGEDVPSQLRASAGSTRGDIEVVVMTHLHDDHASAISEFPESTFVAQRDRVEGGDHRPAAAAPRLPPAPTTTTPSTTARSTSTATPIESYGRSAAPSTSSATARSASPTRPGTAPATSP